MESKIRFLALGDSYTIGEKVEEEGRWPVILADYLIESDYAVEPPQIIATTGWTTAELMEGIKNAAPEGKYDLVSLLIGVNNQYRGYSKETYSDEFEELLQLAISFAGGIKDNVFVLSIPDYGVTPFAIEKDPDRISKEINDFNLINKNISEKNGVSYFDITPISKNAKHDNSLLAEDGLHPSGKMYKLWVDIVKESILAKLKKNRG
jgi:lysophospholipase L1-like esterase